MKVKPIKIEKNIYILENGKYKVDMNYYNTTTNKKARTRKYCDTLQEARVFREEFRAKVTLNLLPMQDEKVSLGFMIDYCLEIKQDRKSFDSIQRHLNEIGEYFGRDRKLETIKDRDVRTFTRHLKTREKKGYHCGKLSNQSIDHVLKELRFLLRAAEKQRYIQDRPEVKFLGNYGHRKLALDVDQLKKVIGELPAEPFPHRAMCWMALNTGQRRTDLANMTWDQLIETEKGTIVEFKSTKTHKEGMMAPLLDPTKEALERLRKYSQSEYIFPNPKTGKPYKDIRKALTSACERAGVERFTMHTMRHLATTVLLKASKGDRDAVYRIIGWAKIDTMDRYGHVGDRAFSIFETLNKSLTQNSEAIAC